MCAGLADLFSDDFRNAHAEGKITAQSIIILRIPTFIVNYDKFIILISSSIEGDEIAAVCINTKPTPKGNHIVIKKAEYEFLDYDSHIDCSSLIPFEKEWLRDLLKNEPARYKGMISETLYIDIIMKIRQSYSISVEEREKFNL
jgi:hypothetical protein